MCSSDLSLATIEFGEETSKAVAIYNDKKNIQVFDVFLDKILYKQLGKAIKNSHDKDLVKLVGMDIDFYNVMSILRGKFWNIDEEQIKDLIVSHTSSVPRDLLGKMISSDSVRGVMDELASSRYRDLIPQDRKSTRLNSSH